MPENEIKIGCVTQKGVRVCTENSWNHAIQAQYYKRPVFNLWTMEVMTLLSKLVW